MIAFGMNVAASLLGMPDCAIFGFGSPQCLSRTHCGVFVIGVCRSALVASSAPSWASPTSRHAGLAGQVRQHMPWYCISETAGIGVLGVCNHQQVVCDGMFLLQQSSSAMQAIACKIYHSTHTPVWTAYLAISSHILCPSLLALS